MSRSPVKKRPRTASDEEEAKPHSTFWFPDGSIVLQAENVQFKVHQSTLALHSPIFESMLASARPNGKDSVEGCAVVHLYGDAASDVEAMLRVIVGGGRLYKPQEVVSFDTLRAFLHMSAKYDIAALRVDALSRLRAKFPSAESASSYNYIRQDEGLPWRIDSYPGIEYDLANLAREHRIWDVLPVLYLRVLTHDGYEWEHVLDGFPAPKQSSQAPNVRKLSLDNRRAVLLGERRLTHHQSACIAAWISPTCTGGRACRDALALKRLAHMDPRFFLVFWGAWRAGLEARLCEHCRSHARGQYTVQQDQTWRDLPEFFDLPSWDVLISCTEANAELPTSVENV